MRRVESIELPAGESILVEPGGFHVMLMGLEEPLVEGESFPLVLRFERAGTVEVTVEIAPPGDATKHGSHEAHGTAA